jgi:hypothetical protein
VENPSVVTSCEGRRSTLAFLVLIFLLALAMRLPTLTMGVWLDECISMFVAKQPTLGQFIAQLQVMDFNPPLSHFILRYVIKYFGDDAIVVKLPALISSLLLVPAVYWLGKISLNSKIGLMAAFFAAISPLANYFSCQSRPYSLAMLLSCLSVAFYLKLLDAHSRQPVACLVAFVLITTMLLYTHTVGVVLLGSLFLAYLWLYFRARLNSRSGLNENLRLGLGYHIPAFWGPTLAFLFWVPTILKQMALPRWIAATRLQDMWYVFPYDLAMYNPLPLWAGLLTVYCLLTVFFFQLLRFTVKSGLGKLCESLKGGFCHLPYSLVVLLCASLIPAFLVGYITPFQIGYFRYIMPFTAAGWVLYAALLSACFKKQNADITKTSVKSGKFFVLAVSLLIMFGIDLSYVLIFDEKPQSGLRSLALDAHEGKYDGCALMVAPDVIAPTLAYYLRADERAKHKILLCGFSRFKADDPCALEDLFAAWGPEAVVEQAQEKILGLASQGCKELAFVADKSVVSTALVPKEERIKSLYAWLEAKYPKLEKDGKGALEYRGVTEAVKVTFFDLSKPK